MSVDYAEVYRLAKKGRKAEQRSKAAAKIAGAFITGILLSLFKGWLFMLAIAVAHEHWWPKIPTIGFWWSVLFVALLPSFGNSSSKSKSE